MAKFLTKLNDVESFSNSTTELEKAQSSQAALDELQTERFNNTLRSYYSYREAEDKFNAMSSADLLEYFYEDRSWRNNNTVSMSMDLVNMTTETDQNRLKEFAYIQQTYEALPSFWNDPNRNFGGWLIDNGGAMLSDPINLIGVGVGGQAAKQSYKIGLKELLKGKMANEINKAAIEELAQQSTQASLGKAIAKGALYEGYIGAFANGVQDTLLQNTAIKTGVQTEMDLKQTALSTAAGFGLGTVFGGVFSAGSFSLTTRNLKNTSVKQLVDIHDYGKSTITGRKLYEALAVPKKESELFKNLTLQAAEEVDPTTTPDTFRNRFNIKIAPITSADKPPTIPTNVTRYKKGDYQYVIKQKSKEIKNKVDSADPKTFEEMVDIAAQSEIRMGGSPAVIRKKMIALAKNSSTKEAFVNRIITGNFIAKDANELIEISNTLSRTDLSPKKRLELENLWDDISLGLDDLLIADSNFSTGSALGVTVGRVIKDKVTAAKLISQPEDPKMASLKKDNIKKFREAIGKLDDNEQVILALQNARKADTWDLAAEYVNNNLLSSPDTHILNLVSGLVQTQWKPFIMLLRAANMSTRDTQRATELAREALETYIYQYVYLGHALKAAGKTFVKGRATLDSAQMKFDSNIRQGQLQRWISETGKLLTDPMASIATRISNEAAGNVVGKIAQAPIEAVGLVTTLPMRVLSAGDEFLKTMAFKARLTSIVNTEIMKQNPDYGIYSKGKLFSKDYNAKFKEIEKKFVNEKGVAEAIGTTVGETINSPLQYAREVSYTQSAYSTNPITSEEDGGFTGGILKASQSSGWKWTRPFGLHFINTPSNLLRWNFQHLPVLGRYQFQMRHMLAEVEDVAEKGSFKGFVRKGTAGVTSLMPTKGKNYLNPEAAAEANARIQAGYLIWGAAVGAVMGGKFTGGGSKDWKATQQKEQLTGWQPYSYVTEDGRYIALNRLDPLFTPIFLAADIWETISKLQNSNEDLPPEIESWATELSLGTMLAIQRNVTSKFYTKNFFDMMAAMSNGGDLRAARPEQKLGMALTKNLAIKNLPLSGGLRYADRISDNWEKDIWDSMDLLSTYFSDNLMEKPMPKRNMFGKTIERKNGWLFGIGGDTGLWSSPFAMTKWKNTETAAFFKDREITYRPPSSMDRYVKGLDLRNLRNSEGQTAYDRWLEIKSDLKLNARGMVSKSGKYDLQEFIEKIIADKGSSLYLQPNGLYNNSDKQQQFITRQVYSVETVAYWDMVKEFPEITDQIKNLDEISKEAYKQARENRNIYREQESSLQKLMKYGK